jgi:hypothetical protein
MADVLQTGTLTTGGDNPFPTQPPDSNVVDLFPSKTQVAGATKALTGIQEQKVATDDAMMRQWNQRDERSRAEMERMRAAQGAELSNLKPWNAQEELGKREVGLWEQFGSPAFLVAMMGSAFSAMPMVSALNAGGAAINAMNQGKMADYQRAFDAWKSNTDLTIKRSKLEADLYEEIASERTRDMAAWRAKATAIATRFDDKRKLALLQNGMDHEVWESIDAQAKAAKDMATSQTAITEAKERMDILNADPRYHDPKTMQQAINDLNEGKLTPEQQLWKQAFDPNKPWNENLDNYRKIREAEFAYRSSAGALTVNKQTAIEIDRRTKDYEVAGLDHNAAFDRAKKEVRASDTAANLPPEMTPQVIDKMADRWLSSGGDPSTLPPGRGAAMQATIRAVIARALEKQEALGQTSGDLLVRKGELKADYSTLTKLKQQQAAINQFEQTAVKNGAVLVDLANKVDESGVPVIERWTRNGRRKLEGDADVSQFNAQMNLYRAEVAKILTNPNMTGVLTDSSREEAKEFLSGEDSALQINAVVKLLTQDFARRETSLESEVERVQNEIRGVPTPAHPPEISSDPLGLLH